jgi:hypothetical protein
LISQFERRIVDQNNSGRLGVRDISLVNDNIPSGHPKAQSPSNSPASTIQFEDDEFETPSAQPVVYPRGGAPRKLNIYMTQHVNSPGHHSIRDVSISVRQDASILRTNSTSLERQSTTTPTTTTSTTSRRCLVAIYHQLPT